MKLRDGFITYNTGDEQIMVAAGATAFRGMVRSNRTAAYMVDCLKADITREALLDKLEAKYDAPRSVLAADLDRVLEQLRRIGALDE